MSHNNRGSSQIDYILCTTPGILKSVTVEEKHFLNQSSHTSVCAVLNTKALPKQKVKCDKRTISKLNWEKLDKNQFQHTLNTTIEGLSEGWSLEPEEAITHITECLKQATVKSVPSRVVRLQGPRFKASPVAKTLLKSARIHILPGKGLDHLGRKGKYTGRGKMQRKSLDSEYAERIISTRRGSFQT